MGSYKDKGITISKRKQILIAPPVDHRKSSYEHGSKYRHSSNKYERKHDDKYDDRYKDRDSYKSANHDSSKVPNTNPNCQKILNIFFPLGRQNL